MCRTYSLHRYSETKLCLCFPYKIYQKIARLGRGQIFGHYSGTLLLSFSEKIHTYVCMYMCLSHVCRYPWKMKEGIKSPGTGITSSCEPLREGAKNQSYFSGPYHFLVSFLKSYLLSWCVYVSIACVCDVAHTCHGMCLEVRDTFYSFLLLQVDDRNQTQAVKPLYLHILLFWTVKLFEASF